MLHDHLWNTLAKQNNQVIWLRHNGENKHLVTPLSMYFLDMLVMDLFPIYFTQNHYFCFYFLTLAFYFVPSLDNQFSVYFSLATVASHSRMVTLTHSRKRKQVKPGRRASNFVVVLFWVLLYVHRNRRFIKDGSPGRPPRLTPSSWSLCSGV